MAVLRMVNKAIGRVEEFIIAGSIIIMSALLVLNVFMRAVMNNSLTFTDEAGRFLIIIVTFIGSSYAARQGRHIRMSAIYAIFPKTVRKVMMIFITLLTSAVLMILAYFAWKYTQFNFYSGRVSNALEVPMYLIYVFVPIGMFLTGVQYFLTMITNFIKEDVYVSPNKDDSEIE
jgi:C4-dicarboxylate transporter DctQ subunit